jgi:hypothetical protein
MTRQYFGLRFFCFERALAIRGNHGYRAARRGGPASVARARSCALGTSALIDQLFATKTERPSPVVVPENTSSSRKAYLSFPTGASTSIRGNRREPTSSTHGPTPAVATLHDGVYIVRGSAVFGIPDFVWTWSESGALARSAGAHSCSGPQHHSRRDSDSLAASNPVSSAGKRKWSPGNYGRTGMSRAHWNSRLATRRRPSIYGTVKLGLRRVVFTDSATGRDFGGQDHVCVCAARRVDAGNTTRTNAFDATLILVLH